MSVMFLPGAVSGLPAGAAALGLCAAPGSATAATIAPAARADAQANRVVFTSSPPWLTPPSPGVSAALSDSAAVNSSHAASERSRSGDGSVAMGGSGGPDVLGQALGHPAPDGVMVDGGGL